MRGTVSSRRSSGGWHDRQATGPEQSTAPRIDPHFPFMNTRHQHETLAPAAWINAAWDRSAAKLRRTSRRIGDTFPHVSKNGRYDAAPVHWWTAGFWPGLLWLVYRETHDDALRALAESCERQLDRTIVEFDDLYHDVGFMWSLTAVARYKLLGADESRRRSLLAASLLASRFNLRGRFLRAWNEDRVGWAIIDSLMNLPILYWASERLGDPRFKYIAMAHADTALRHFVRDDGSCRHIVSFDPVTGDFIEALGGQGESPDSAWSRGSAWALYGFTLSYKYTGEVRYLEAASRVAHFFVSHLPADLVPYWDFRAPVTAETPRDSSAGACAASGLLELASLAPTPDAALFQNAAVALLRALDTQCGAWDADEEGLLRMGTGHVPEGQNINVSLIYGDYFFVEALAKLRGQRELFW